MAKAARPLRGARTRAAATTSGTKRTAKKAARRSSDASHASDAGIEFQKLVDIMRPFVLEETYEVLDAIDRADHDALRGEIGDFLFEGVFLAQLESDEGRFSVSDSLRVITAKLIRRHPHVFGTEKDVKTPGKVLEQWEAIKAREQTHAGQTRSVLRGMPKALPALLGAHEIGTRVAAVGFDWAKSSDVVAKIEE